MSCHHAITPLRHYAITPLRHYASRQKKLSGIIQYGSRIYSYHYALNIAGLQSSANKKPSASAGLTFHAALLLHVVLFL